MAASAPVDRLTGVLTRDVLDEIDGLFATRAGDDDWSVMIVDVDDFKMVNDIQGHLAGDRVLQQVAWLLLRTVRDTDRVVRFGGDEFLVVFPSTGSLQAANMAQRFLEDVGSESFPGGMRIGVSLGLAESTVGERDLSSVIGRADQALYESKARGKSRMSFFSTPVPPGQALSFEHFVDRQGPLRALRSAFDAMIAGGGGLVLVTGEPGVGKSRLARELQHYSAFRDAVFQIAKYDELGGSGPFVTVTDAMCAIIEDLPLDSRHEVCGEVGAVLPETAMLFPPLPLEVSGDRPPPEWARGRMLYMQCGRILRALAAWKPIVLLLDDIQWSRRQDLDLLGYLIRTAGGDRVLFVFTMRSPVEAHHEAWSWMKGLMKLTRSERIDLQPLEREHSSNMIMLALRDSRVPPALLDGLVSESGGNPFYLGELLRSLVESGSIRPDGAGGWTFQMDSRPPLPGSVADLVRSRLDMLAPASREALRMCALATGGMRLLDLAYLMEAAPLEAARAIEAPLSMEILQEDTAGPAEDMVLHFNHDCVRACLLDELPAGLRRHLYTRLGQRFEEEWRTGRPDMLQRAAFSYSEGSVASKAAEFALLAADDARARQATYDHAAWLERFVAAAGSAGGAFDADLFRAWRDLGRLHAMHARNADAAAALQRAASLASTPAEEGSVALLKASLAEEMSDQDGALAEYRRALSTGMPTEQVVRAMTGIAWISHTKGETFLALGILDEARALLEEIPDGSTRARLEASWLSNRGALLAQTGDDENGLSMCRAALDFYESAGDTIHRAKAQVNLAMILSTFPAWEERIRLLRESTASFVEVGDVQSLMSATQALGSVHLELNQISSAEECFRRCLDLAEASGSPGRIASARERLGASSHARGDQEAALEQFEAAASTAGDADPSPTALIALCWIARTLSSMGRQEEARGSLERLGEGPHPTGMTAWERSRTMFLEGAARTLLSRNGDVAALEASLGLVRGARAVPGGPELLESLEMMWTEIGILTRLGRTAEARGLLEEASCLLDLCLTAIENPLLREGFGRLEFVSGLAAMSGDDSSRSGRTGPDCAPPIRS